MSADPLLAARLHPPIQQTARAGKLGFPNRISNLLKPCGWRVQVRPSGDAARADALSRPGYALFNMERPTHDRVLTFRLVYHYAYWRL